MRRSNLKYFIIEGFKSFFVNRLMSIASIVIVTACLLVFGLYIAFSVNLNYIGEQLREQYEITAYVSKETPAKRIEEIGRELERIDNVEKVGFISKEDRLLDVSNDIMDDAGLLESYLQDNPLRDSYRITMKDFALADETIAQFEQIPELQAIKGSREIMNGLLGATRTIRLVSLCLMIFMTLISVFIISNTIEITVFARRKDISVMKFVGATDWFIRWPFIIEGIIIGIIGAGISFFVIAQGYSQIVQFAISSFRDIIKLSPYEEVQVLLGVLLVGSGALMGAIGSGISVKKHLNV